MPRPALQLVSRTITAGWRPAMRAYVSALAALLATTTAFSPAGWPQEATVSIQPRAKPISQRAGRQPNIRMDINLVLVPVTVTDAFDHPVTGLDAGSFRLFEDNVEQKIVSVVKEDGPVSVGFIFDTSSSMKKRIGRSVTAVQRFFQTTLPEDEYFLVRFSDRPALVTGFTTHADAILRGLATGEPQGWTALLDAIGLGVHEMKKAKNSRKALFVLTDGGDNDSRYSEPEIRDLVMESDVRVYAIGLLERYRFLEKLAAESGGEAYVAHRMEDLPETVDRLSRDLRSEYVLGYSPNNHQNDGKYRTLRVEVHSPLMEPPLRVAWRRGYYAPPE